MDKISVIIPCFNSRETIRKCVSSILETGYSPLEIILVDDHSTDTTLDVLEEIRQRNIDLVCVVAGLKNLGAGVARNIGACAASGRYYLFIDSDVEMVSTTLNQFSRTIKTADSVSGHYHWQPLNNSVVANYKAYLNYSMNTREGIFRYEVFNSAIAGIRSEVFLSSGGFSENLRPGMDYENEEFGHRLYKQHITLFDPSLVVRHHFPGFWRLTRNYFWRVSLWMELFCKRKDFEQGGLGSSRTGLATVSLFIGLMMLLAANFSSYCFFVAVPLLLGYLKGYYPLLLFTIRKKPGLLVPVLVLNMYYCIVITIGAATGVFRFLTNRRATIA